MASTLRWQVAQSAERKWWQNYLRKKDVATYLTWKKEYWANFLNSIKQYVPTLTNKNILDIGCGPAGIFIILQEQTCTAVDPLLNKYEQDLAHFKKSHYPQTTFINSDIESFSSAKKYDVIFCLNAINHVKDIEASYKNLVNLLNPNGILVISVDAHRHKWLQPIFKIIPGDVLHPHQYNLQEYTNFLKATGLHVLDTQLVKEELIFNYYVQVAQKK
jgi:2-polyprenyl-3-methyl-5-hydroxy-6-metoxy-1,4-benzoquinol methylase